jgi:hypothetical protein
VCMLFNMRKVEMLINVAQHAQHGQILCNSKVLEAEDS